MAGGTRAVMAAMIANGLIAAAKFTAAAVTGSAAMVSEGIHSVADTGNQALLLFGDRRSRKRPDRRHPLGYGPELYFWSLVVAMILFGLGGGFSLYEGISHLGHPEVPGSPLWSYGVLGVAFVVEAIALRTALRSLHGGDSLHDLWKRLRESRDPRAFVPVSEDLAALLGIVVAFVGIWSARRFDMPALDAVASMVIGVILAGVALFLAYETRTLLVGESIDESLRDAIHRACGEEEAIRGIVRMAGVTLGPDEVLLGLGLRFRDRLETEDVARAASRLEERLRTEDSRVTRVFVEAEERGDPGGLAPPY